MKKFILLFIIAVFNKNYSCGQSFSLNETGPITISEQVSPNSMDEVYIQVTNNSSISKNVQVERIIINHPEGGSFYYCWTQCYLASSCLAYAINGSPTNIAAGATSNLFSAHYDPNDIVGINSINYCFFDNDNPTDRTCIIINHDATEAAVGIQEVSSNSNFLSPPQPNPSSTTTSIVYNLTSLNNGKIVLRNMLGSVIKEIELDKASDSKTVDVSALNAGIYFYSLINNGSIVSSQRLVVK